MVTINRTHPRPFFRQWILLLLIGAATCSATWAEPVKMTFLSPEQADSEFWFWREATRFMRLVADDLDVELEVVHTRGASTYAVKKAGMEIVNRPEPPDYLLTGYWNEAVGDVFEASKDSGTRIFLFNAPVMRHDLRRMTHPRTLHKHWIGQMLPDETEAGYRLASILLERARALKTDPGQAPVKIAALTANQRSSVSYAREQGLRKAVDEHQAVLTSVAGTSWQRTTADAAAEQILDEHPDTRAIWAISDGAAFSVIDEVKQRGLNPGADVLTGGFDWSEAGIEAIRRGSMTASMGGHFTQGGWAVILAYDYHHGIDFAESLGLTIATPMHAITAGNIDRYTALINNPALERIDFTELSKARNSNLSAYDFSLDGLLARLKACEATSCN